MRAHSLSLPCHELSRRQFLALAGAAGAMSVVAPARGGLVPLGGSGPGSVAPSGVPNMPAQAIIAQGGSPQQALQNATTLSGLPFSTVVSQFNLFMVGSYLGLETDFGVTWPSVIPGWKTAAAANGVALKCFPYTPGMGTFYNTADTAEKFIALAMNAANMWAYTSVSGSGTTDILEYSGSTSGYQGWFQISPYNTQTVPAGPFNGKTGVLQGYNVWDLYNTYYIDAYIKGSAATKYGEAASLAPNPYWDGIWYDNVSMNLQGISSGGSGQVGVPATWLGPSGALQGWNATSDAAVQSGIAKLLASLRGINPNFLAGGNGAGNIEGTAGNPNYGGGDYEIYNPVTWDYDLAEAVFGESYGFEARTNSPPGFWQNFLAYASSKCLSAGGMLILGAYGYPGGVAGSLGNAQSTWNNTDWSAIRMMYCAAIMAHGMLAANAPAANPADALLWDEQRQAAGANAITSNWFGTMIDPPQTSPWATFVNSLGANVGVWRRRGTNGTAFWVPRQVNGSGNLDTPFNVVVTGAGTGLSYCASETPVGATFAYGDTTVNTGNPISSANGGTVTLYNYGYGTGLVLRTTPI